MPKLILWALILVIPVSGQSVYYGFDGDLSSVFTESGLSDNTYPFQQVAGRLIYHNNGLTTSDTSTLMELLPFKPSVGTTWTLQADVTIPARVNNTITGVEGDPELFIGIGCYNNKDGVVRFFTSEFFMDSQGQKEAKVSAGFGDIEVRNPDKVTVLQESIQLKITYYGGALTLFTGNLGTGSSLLYSLDIAEGGFVFNTPQPLLDWELTQSDLFTLFLVVYSNNFPILPGRPLQIDNLQAYIHGVNQEDGGITQRPALLDVEVKAYPDQISELQKSHDLENWITIKTLSRGIRQQMSLPSDNGQAYYRVIVP